MSRPSIAIEGSARFRLLHQLGSGSFGTVYEALDQRSGQHVAVKQLREVDGHSIARFKHEFRALADLHHPNLVGIKELIEDDGRWLIVMELIPGEDFLGYVRRPRDNDNDGLLAWDEERLRGALLGMADGLAALHRHRVVHRDLKPNNVRVTQEGRAVLLDFGLVTSMDPTEQSVEMLVGTAGYMAPEQAKQHNVGPAADWYALGVCLFEALTGRLPFDGDNALQVLLEKQEQPAPRAAANAPGVPEDLDALCAALLERDPERRASGAEVLRALRGAPSGTDESPATHAPEPLAPATFEGRDSELQQLERAWKRTQAGELKLVLVEGESGVGKSELVAEFLRRARSQATALITLHGRCYENEQVSYKAFDGCIDDLARVLSTLSDSACVSLLPPRAAAMGQVFPVLRNVPAVTRAPRNTISADPNARRLEAFRALAMLLGRLAQERPLVLVIDDLQWADPESFRLLQALVEQPQPVAALLVATIRGRVELDDDVRTQVAMIQGWKQTEVIRLLGLPRAQAEQLAAKLLGPDMPPDWLELIANESEGHPLFLSELVRFARSHETVARGSVTLEAALRARIEGLGRDARNLLEMAVLAARPHGEHIYAQALQVRSVSDPARELLATKLLRARKGNELGVYHDRIRHAAVTLISKRRLPTLHRRLATALAEDPLADVSEQARHWDLAGEVDLAVDAYRRGARAALDALAFLRAEALCASALRLLTDPRDLRIDALTVQRAEALACAGRSAEAAVLYQRGADRAQGDQQLFLSCRAAQQLMLSGDVNRGFAVARSLLAKLGVRIPLNTFATLVQLALCRLWLALFGRSYRTRRSREPPDPHRQLAYDIVERLIGAVSVLHPPAFVVLTVWLMREATRSAIPRGIAYGPTTLGWIRAVGGSMSTALPLFEAGRKLTAQFDDPNLTARQAYVEGSARLAGGDWTGGAACLERAHALVQVHAAEDPNFLTNVRYHLGTVWYTTGAYGRLAQESEVWLAEARERRDVLAIALLLGMGNCYLRHVMQDAPDAALAELDAAFADLPEQPFSFLHFGRMTATQVSLLYRGGPDALRWLDAREAAFARPLLLKTHMGKRTLNIVRALACLAACVGAAPKERAALLKRARKAASWLARDAGLFGQAYGELVLAQIEAVEGHVAAGLTRARRARSLAEVNHLGIAKSASYLETLLQPKSDTQRTRAREILARLQEEGWREPLRALTIGLPSLPLLAPLEPQAASRAGLVRGYYETVGALGGGAFGSVVEARDVRTDRRVALKELVSHGRRSLAGFKQEFRSLQDLHHTNLMQVEALFEEAGTWYIAMELVEGEELLTHVRQGGALRPERVWECFAGLASGLAALHDAGFVHRDVTPENVRVTSEGHAVLFDFERLVSIGEEGAPSGAPETGTGSVYAPPEQLEGAAAQPSADVYALGACLYHVLRGAPPFRASQRTQLLREKRVLPAPPPTLPALAPLAELSIRMLSPVPSARPSLQEVRQALSTDVSLARVPPLTPQYTSAHFTGRERELALLSDAFERTCDDGMVVMLVEGVSGIGKSALVASFGAKLEENIPGLLVLRGRCYESEQAAFKAFDATVDQLAEALRALPNPSCESLLPKHAALLSQLFPVLGTVPAIAQASRKGLPAEPVVRHAAAVDAFVELLENMIERHELLFLLDDLQWADPESLRLLRVLLSRRATLPLLVVGTLRPLAELPPADRNDLGALHALPGVESLALQGLSQGAVADLARALSKESLAPERLQQLVHESAGHPLFVRELVARACSGEAATAGSLDDALHATFQELDEEAQTLLILVALAEKPYDMHVYARAMSKHALPRAPLAGLLSRGLLRRSGEHKLTCHHDRIRHAALRGLTPDLSRGYARMLASALDPQRGADAAERARLWEAAGDVERAVDAYEQAARQAIESLAFAHVEQHCARALALLDAAVDDRWRRLSVQRGHALASLGRSADAAHTFQAAAAQCEGEQSVSLRLLAAQHLIQSAQVASGLEAAHALLAELDLSIPRHPAGALTRLLWDRAILSVRGIELRRREAPPNGEDRLRLDAAWSLALPMAWVDPLASAALSGRHLRLSLSVGEPSHAARALAEAAFFRAVSDPADDRADKFFAQARSLGAQCDDPVLEAMLSFREGVTSTFRWQLGRAGELLEHALAVVTERCPEQVWLRTNIRTALGTVWHNCGDHARLSAATTAWMSEARERNDQFALPMISGLGVGVLRHLMRDRSDEALAEVAQYHAPWREQSQSYAQLSEMLGVTTSLIYRGGAEALAWFDRELPRLRRMVLLKDALGKGMLLCFYSSALLHACAQAEGPEAARLLARARDITAQIRRIPSMFVEHFLPMVELAVALCAGRREELLPEFARVRQLAVERGNFLTYGPMLYGEGALEGGDSGRVKCDEALALYKRQGWQRPDCAVRMFCPAIALLDRERP